jgi:alkaline phosphatase
LKRIPIFVLNAIAFIFILFGLHTLLTSESAEIPKNVIIMVSDGCGYDHIDAANMYQYGKTGVQAFEKFPVRYAMSTYSEDGEGYDPDQAWKQFDYVKKKFTDSAAAITAISTGVKTHNINHWNIFLNVARVSENPPVLLLPCVSATQRRPEW